MKTLFGKIENISINEYDILLNIITDLSLQTISAGNILSNLLIITKSSAIQEINGKLIRVCFNDNNEMIALGSLYEDKFIELDDPYIILSQSTIEMDEDVKKSNRR